MKPAVAILSAVAAALLASCASFQPVTSYEAPPGALMAVTGAPDLTVGAFSDPRRTFPHAIGNIEGTFGQTTQIVRARRPVAIMVRSAFVAGMNARGYRTGREPVFTVSGVIKHFDCRQRWKLECRAEVELNVEHETTGRFLYSKTYSLTRSEFVFGIGVFASPDDMRGVAGRTMIAVIDSALDDPNFRDAFSPRNTATGWKS